MEANCRHENQFIVACSPDGKGCDNKEDFARFKITFTVTDRNNFVCVHTSGVEVRYLLVDWSNAMTTAGANAEVVRNSLLAVC